MLYKLQLKFTIQLKSSIQIILTRQLYFHVRQSQSVMFSRRVVTLLPCSTFQYHYNVTAFVTFGTISYVEILCQKIQIICSLM